MNGRFRLNVCRPDYPTSSCGTNELPLGGNLKHVGSDLKSSRNFKSVVLFVVMCTSGKQ